MSNQKEKVPKDVETQNNYYYEDESRDLSCCGFIKNSSTKDRVSIAALVVIALAIIALIISFTLTDKNELSYDNPPHEWLLTREMWGALPLHHNETTDKFDPLKLVVIHHTVSGTCSTFERCAAHLRILQAYFVDNHEYDIPYNFVIGNDGRVYEGRGWGMEGAQRVDFNRCTLLIGFVGDYRGEIEEHNVPTEAQFNRTRMIIAEGVRLGHLRQDYRIVGAKDITTTASPGSLLYEAIQQWDEYDNETTYKGLTCEQIYDMEVVDEEPDTWFIGRKMWESREIEITATTEKFDPLMLVVIQHTLTTECFSLAACSMALRNLQTSAINSGHLDIVYNFVIGNDGRVYEGRGWGKDGAQRFDFNRCSLNVGFIGDYREEIEGHTEVTEAQLNSARKLFEEGVKLGHLRSDFYVVGAKDLMSSSSPGSNLYNAIQQWDESNHNLIFRDMTCEEIYDMHG